MSFGPCGTGRRAGGQGFLDGVEDVERLRKVRCRKCGLEEEKRLTSDQVDRVECGHTPHVCNRCTPDNEERLRLVRQWHQEWQDIEARTL